MSTSLEVKSVTRPSWTPLPYEGSVGVEVKGLIRLEHVSLAMLRFASRATIHEHPADIDIDVICLEGQGFTSVGDQTAALAADQYVRWPAGLPHRLWTEEHEMVTLMVEHEG